MAFKLARLVMEFSQLQTAFAMGNIPHIAGIIYYMSCPRISQVKAYGEAEAGTTQVIEEPEAKTNRRWSVTHVCGEVKAEKKLWWSVTHVLGEAEAEKKAAVVGNTDEAAVVGDAGDRQGRGIDETAVVGAIGARRGKGGDEVAVVDNAGARRGKGGDNAVVIHEYVLSETRTSWQFDETKSV
ncbi:hypothetical protein ACLOJK_013802 [Asimina triloba]